MKFRNVRDMFAFGATGLIEIIVSVVCFKALYDFNHHFNILYSKANILKTRNLGILQVTLTTTGQRAIVHLEVD